MSILYHGSNTPGLTLLEPRPSGVIDGESAVFATTSEAVALSFLAAWSDDDFVHGSHDGQMYMEEKRPGNFERFFQGKTGYIYSVDSADFHSDPRLTEYELIASSPQQVVSVKEIPDIWVALQQTSFHLIKAKPLEPKRSLGMNRHEYFLKALNDQTVPAVYARKGWVLSMFAIGVQEDPDDYPWKIRREKGGIFFKNPENNMEWDALGDANPNGALFDIHDRFQLKAGDMVNVKSDIDTIAGNMLFNAMVLIWPFGDKFDFVTGRVDAKKLEVKVVARLTDYPPPGQARDPSKIYVDELLKYNEAISTLPGFAPICVPAASPKSLTVSDRVLKERDRLVALHRHELKDPAVIADIEKKLVAMDKEDFKGDVAEGFLIGDKPYAVARKRMFILHGTEVGFGEGNLTYITSSLNDGWDINNLPAMVDSLRAGSYNRGKQTELGGEAVKYFHRVFQNTRIIEKDCGVKEGMPWIVSQDNYRKLVALYRAGPSNDTTKALTEEELKGMIGKLIFLRSPQFCKTRAPSYCARCMGDILAMNPNSIPTQVSAVGSKMMSIFLAKVHANVLSVEKYDFSTALE